MQQRQQRQRRQQRQQREIQREKCQGCERKYIGARWEHIIIKLENGRETGGIFCDECAEIQRRLYLPFNKVSLIMSVEYKMPDLASLLPSNFPQAILTIIADYIRNDVFMFCRIDQAKFLAIEKILLRAVKCSGVILTRKLNLNKRQKSKLGRLINNTWESHYGKFKRITDDDLFYKLTPCKDIMHQIWKLLTVTTDNLTMQNVNPEQFKQALIKELKSHDNKDIDYRYHDLFEPISNVVAHEKRLFKKKMAKMDRQLKMMKETIEYNSMFEKWIINSEESKSNLNLNLNLNSNLDLNNNVANNNNNCNSTPSPITLDSYSHCPPESLELLHAFESFLI